MWTLNIQILYTIYKYYSNINEFLIHCMIKYFNVSKDNNDNYKLLFKII